MYKEENVLNTQFLPILCTRKGAQFLVMSSLLRLVTKLQLYTVKANHNTIKYVELNKHVAKS